MVAAGRGPRGATRWWCQSERVRLPTRRISSLLVLLVLVVVAVPTLVASYRHARDVVRRVGDPVMAPWLPASMVGLLLAALGVIWLRRRGGQPVGAGPWGAFGFAMLVIVGANLATVSQGSMLAYAVALFPPCALAITLELAAAICLRRMHHSRGRTQPSPPSVVTPEPELAAGMLGNQRAVTSTRPEHGHPEHDHPEHDHPEHDHPEHDQEQISFERGNSDRVPMAGRGDFLGPHQPVQRASRLRPSPDPGGGDPDIAGVTRRLKQDDPQAGEPSVASDALGKAAVAVAGAERGVDTARTEVVQTTNLLTAPEEPQRGEPIATPAPPPAPSASTARPVRSSAKSSRAGERATTARSVAAASTPGARSRTSTSTRTSTRTRRARAHAEHENNSPTRRVLRSNR